MRGTKTNCLTCGKEYKVCPHCGDASWRHTACSPVCWQISTIINQHFYNLLDAVSAKEDLERIHYQDVPLTEETKAQVDAIIAEAKAQAKRHRKASVQDEQKPENA